MMKILILVSIMIGLSGLAANASDIEGTWFDQRAYPTSSARPPLKNNEYIDRTEVEFSHDRLRYVNICTTNKYTVKLEVDVAIRYHDRSVEILESASARMTTYPYCRIDIRPVKFWYVKRSKIIELYPFDPGPIGLGGDYTSMMSFCDEDDGCTVRAQP